ncbi:MAG: hypothetical protein NZO58_14325, partial [Gemmataceae bacterium]|nr:hypothetical protein [Gemmataceae bacterium]
MTMAGQAIQPAKVDIVQTTPVPLPQASAPRTGFWSVAAPALLSGLLCWMCYFPLAWGWLGWIALVPLLSLVRVQAAPRRIYFAAYFGGGLFFVTV